MARERRGTDFDPELVDTFLKISDQAQFWDTLEQESAQRTVLAMKPPSRFDVVSDSQVETVCQVVADFTDIKSRQTWDHSPTVAAVASDIGLHLGMGKEDVTRLRRAALVHDLGKVAIPAAVLENQDNLSQAEWESFRLHPYYTERILDRVAKLRDLAPESAAHHEWMNGQGYHRQTSGDQIPLGGRILAVADTYAVLSNNQPQGSDPRAISQQMRPLIGSQLDPMCFEALVASQQGEVPSRARRLHSQRPGNLSDRETELLRELAKGLTNKQIGKALFISNKTVERHLENIYNKLGVSTRTSAVVFAVQNGIVA